MKVAGKVWVVTGGGNGIGRELVLLLLRQGARVAAVDIRGDDLGDTARLANAADRLTVHEVDITDRAATEALVDAVVDAHGAVDGLINNAGIIQPFVPVNDMDYATIDRVLNINLMGTIYMTKSFLPTLMTRPEAHVVNVSSMGGFFPFPGQTIYGASKAAVKLLTEGLYTELLDTAVRVSLVMPGAVTTDITARSGVDMAGSSEDSKIPQTAADKAAQIIIHGIERDRLHILVGKDARVMDIAIKLAPKQAMKFVQRQMKGLLAD